MTDTATGAFLIYGNNMNQVGTFYVNVTAQVTAYPTRTASA